MSDHAPSRPCVFCSAVLRVFSPLLSHCFGLLTVAGVRLMDWTTWWCVRHGLDYLVVCSSWIGLPGGVCVMDWTTWWCVRHGLDYLVVCASWTGLPGGVFFVQICRRNQEQFVSVYFFIGLFPLLAVSQLVNFR